MDEDPHPSVTKDVAARRRPTQHPIALPGVPGYGEGMVDPKPDPMVSNEEEVEVGAAIAAAIDRGMRAANEGRVVTSEEVRKLIPQWIFKFSTQNQR